MKRGRPRDRAEGEEVGEAMRDRVWGEGFAVGIVAGMAMFMLAIWSYGVSCSAPERPLERVIGPVSSQLICLKIHPLAGNVV
jgi:hypothetical protein